MLKQKKLRFLKKAIINLNLLRGGQAFNTSGGDDIPSGKPGSICNNRSKIQNECASSACRNIPFGRTF
jgi:hypothetical protein